MAVPSIPATKPPLIVSIFVPSLPKKDTLPFRSTTASPIPYCSLQTDFKIAVKEIAEFFYPMLLDNVRLNTIPAQKSSIQLYPNPSTGSCTFKLPKDQKSVEIRIYNVHAQLQFSTIITETTTLKLPLNSGLYKVVMTGKHAQTETLVVEYNH